MDPPSKGKARAPPSRGVSHDEGAGEANTTEATGIQPPSTEPDPNIPPSVAGQYVRTTRCKRCVMQISPNIYKNVSKASPCLGCPTRYVPGRCELHHTWKERKCHEVIRA